MKRPIFTRLTLAVAVAAAVGYARIATAAALGALGVTHGSPGASFGQAGAVVNKLSSALTNRDATPQVLNSQIVEKGTLRESQGFADIANGDSATSTYRLFSIRSSERLSQLLVYSPDIGTTTAGDVGLYETTKAGSAVVDVDFFASAVSLSGGALNGSDITFEAAAAGGLIANAEKPVWQALGLTSDPGKEYDVVLTLTGAADAAGVALFRACIVAQG